MAGTFVTLKEASVDLPNGKRLTAQLTRSEFSGVTNEFVSLRSWFKDEESGKFLPEKKGVTFSPTVVAEVADALRSLA